MSHADASTRVARVASAHSCRGLLRSDDKADATISGAVLRDGTDGSMASRLRSIRLLETGEFVICGECNNDPDLYLNEFEIVCPHCGGVGIVRNEDFNDGSEAFDPHKEWGTERHHRRHF